MTAAVLCLALTLQADSKEAGRALSTFSKAYRTRDVSARAAAVTALAKTDHARVHAKIARLLTADVKEVRIAAAEGLGTTTENRKKVIQYLANAIGPNYKEPDVAAACAKGLERLNAGLGVQILKALFGSPDVRVAKVAVEAAERLRKREFVPMLINLMDGLKKQARAATNIGPGGRSRVSGIPGVSTGGIVDPGAPKRERDLTPVIQKALQSLTGRSAKKVEEWVAWWKEVEADFEVAPTPK